MYAQVTLHERQTPKHCKELTDHLPQNWWSGWIFLQGSLLRLDRWVCFLFVKNILQHPENFVLAWFWLQNRRPSCSKGPVRNHTFKNFSTSKNPVPMFAHTNMNTPHQTHAFLTNLIKKCSHKVITFSVLTWVSLISPAWISAFHFENVACSVL